MPKTAINTPFGQFQFRVMGFGLTNSPAIFMSVMNDVLRPFLRKSIFCAMTRQVQYMAIHCTPKNERTQFMYKHFTKLAH